MKKLRDNTAEEILKRLNDTENYPEETLAPYEQFTESSRGSVKEPPPLSLVQRVHLLQGCSLR